MSGLSDRQIVWFPAPLEVEALEQQLRRLPENDLLPDAQDFGSSPRSDNRRRQQGSVTVVATRKTDEKTSRRQYVI